MKKKKFVYADWLITLLAALSAFCVYTCMYAYRKPFTASDFEGYRFLQIDYKVWLIIAQTIGYTCSKFFGIGFIGGLRADKRATSIIRLVAIAWVALLFFAIFPAPYNIVFLLINGFPLGVIYGLVFSYLEGRRTTELLGAVLASSFIFASGFTQSAGKYVMLEWGISMWWMPWVTGLLSFPVLVACTWLLEKTPAPDYADTQARTARKPMSKRERRHFLKTFFPGLFFLILAYILLTIIRDYRSNFAADIWKELGYGSSSAVFTQSEIPASLTVLLLMSLLIFVRKNIQALLLNHLIIVAGFMVAAGATLLYTADVMSPFWWMTCTGIGLYMGYVPFNCMLFERLIASFRYVSNAGFIIYVADAFGYLGSDVILIAKNLWKPDISWSAFFAQMILVSSLAGTVLIGLAAMYFSRKYQRHFFLSNTGLKYG